MVEIKRRLFSIPLLVVLFLAIVPAETFHKHQFESVICHESIHHFENDHFECELCDFILPVFDSQTFQLHFNLSNTYYSYSNTTVRSITPAHFSLPSYRAPPLFF